MDWHLSLFDPNEKPLERPARAYSYTSIFRSIAFIGDSLSSGEFETRDPDGTRGYHDFYEYSWGQYIARKNGLKAYNFSKGGMSARQYLDSFAQDNGFWESDKACQAYVIALGVNDVLNGGGAVGSVADIAPDYRENKPTFLGRYAAIVSRCKLIRPDAKFFFVVPPRSGSAEKDQRAHSLLLGLRSLTEYFENAYLIDLYSYAPVYDEAFQEKYFLYGHMNPMGYIFTADMIDSYIDYIIRHNMEDFKTSGFIGSSVRYSG